jgi:hypothetical protein
MIKITDTKGQNKKALHMILHVHEICEQYTTAINNISYLGAQNLDGMPHGTGVGNPTQQRALKLTDIEYKKNWIMAVEQMESTLTENQKEFLRLRRLAEQNAERSCVRGRPAWVVFVQTRYNDWYNNRYGKEVFVSEITLKQWQAMIVDKTVRIAIYNGCFDF